MITVALVLDKYNLKMNNNIIYLFILSFLEGCLFIYWN